MQKNSLLRNFLKFGRKNVSDGQTPAVRRIRRNSESDFDEFTITQSGRNGYGRVSAGLINRLCSEADNGFPRELMNFFRNMLEKDPVIAAYVNSRIMAVMSCDWSIVCNDRAKEREVAAVLARAGFGKLISHLMSAAAFGYACSAVMWSEDGGEIRSFKQIDNGNFVFDRGGNPALLTFEGKEKSLAGFHPDQFIFHAFNAGTNSPASGGLLRKLMWIYFFKHYAMRDRARYLERFGIPFIAAKVRNEDFESENTRNEILDSLSKLGSDGVGILGEGADIDVINPSGTSTNDYQSWMDYLDKVTALLVLGQTASSGNASGFSKGQMQENVRRDIIESDCKNLMDTLNGTVIAALERFRYGTAGTIKVKLDYVSPENLTEKAELLKSAVEAGFKADPEWVEQTFGVRLLKN